jgi:hypothetical protein
MGAPQSENTVAKALNLTDEARREAAGLAADVVLVVLVVVAAVFMSQIPGCC